MVEATYPHKYGIPRSAIESAYREALPAYNIGLVKLTDHIISTQPDGILTLGSSARDMWLDIECIAKIQNRTLPPSLNIVDQTSWTLYGGYYEEQKEIYDGLPVYFINPMLIDDYVNTGRKIADIDEFFVQIALPVSYAVLLTNNDARSRFTRNRIKVFEAVEVFDQELMNFLKSRRTSGMQT